MIQQQKIPAKQKARNFLLHWSNFPFDYWWRKKYNVPFGSKAHREMNWIDMLIEYEECLLMARGSFFDEENTEQITQEEIDEDYDNLDLDIDELENA